MTRILIADDSTPVRCGLRTLLGLNSDWHVCGEAVDGADAVEKAHELAPDLILMDFSMPQMDGVQAAQEIAKSGTDIPILLVTLNLSSEIMELARNAGLRGAMSKSEISKLPYAIRALQRGETFFYASEAALLPRLRHVSTNLAD
jgi:DNA-binding NarL/FixJ family response regulator